VTRIPPPQQQISSARLGPAEGPGKAETLQEVDAGAQAGKSAQASGPEPASAPDTAGPAQLGGGLPPAQLSRILDESNAVFARLEAAALPSDLGALVDAYAEAGHALARAEASLISTLDALDPRTGEGRAQPAEPFVALKERGFATIRRAGELFAQIEPAFKKLVHGEGGWPPRPVQVSPDRGDGRPLQHYENTFKLAGDLTQEQKLSEYKERVDGFLAEGGELERLDLATPDDVAAMRHRTRYDYVMLADAQSMRMCARTGPDAMDPGHSLLASGGKDFVDEPVLLAGEMWALRDSAGDLEALFVANNSGHFKPEYEDLVNAVPVLAGHGVPPEKVVVFGGPNNLPAMFAEIEEKASGTLKDLASRLPLSPREMLEQMSAPEVKSPLSVRF
jgi:hypothetical protein